MNTLKTLAILAVCFGIVFIACNSKPSAPPAGKKVGENAGNGGLLTIAEVEAASGKTGLKLIPRDLTKGAVGNLNFAMADGEMIAMLVIADMNIFNQWKDAKIYNQGAINGVGDEAYKAPVGMVQFIVFFRKGTKVASISSFMDLRNAVPYLSIEKLTGLAKIVASRL